MVQKSRPRSKRRGKSGSGKTATAESGVSQFIGSPGGVQTASRVAVIAVGVGEYTHLDPLRGPKSDVQRLRSLLVENTKTALVPEERFTSLVDCDSADVRRAISDYALERSASHDVLILYFSGHATPIGYGDLGLCMKDTRWHPAYGSPIPLNLIRFTDIIETLAAVKVDPVMILDTCYSGTAGMKMEDLQLRKTIQAETGASYALLCSSTRRETMPDQTFSSLLSAVSSRGLDGGQDCRKPSLTLKDLYSELRNETASTFDPTPQLFLGDTLPEFAFVKNVKYRPLREGITRGQTEALLAFWRDGSAPTLSTSVLQGLGSTAHTTYSKLRHPPWELVEKVDRRTARLTPRGVKFMKGELRIPNKIEWDPQSNEWKAAPNSELIAFAELRGE